MAAPDKPPGAFVIQVANLGTEVVVSFTKFIDSRRMQDQQMENILATLSSTKSILAQLGTTINKYKKEVYIEDEITRPTCETCKADLEKLLVILKEADKSGIRVRGEHKYCFYCFSLTRQFCTGLYSKCTQTHAFYSTLSSKSADTYDI